MIFFPTSWIGSDQRMDRIVLAIPFSFMGWRYGRKGERVLSLIPSRYLPTQDGITIRGREYKGGEWGIREVAVVMGEDRIKDVIILVMVGDASFWMRPREIYVDGRKIPVGKGGLPGIFVIEKTRDMISGVYIPEKGKGMFGIRLWLGIGSGSFVRVYPKGSSGSVRIWEVRYPGRIAPDPSYLKDDFDDPDLRRSWMRGDKGIGKEGGEK